MEKVENRQENKKLEEIKGTHVRKNWTQDIYSQKLINKAKCEDREWKKRRRDEIKK